MRVLRSIVQVAALAVFDVWHQRALRYAVAAELVGDEDPRCILQTLQQPLEKALRRPGIAAALHQDVEHDPVLIDGTPEIVQLTPDPDEDLIQVPLVARPRPTPAKLIRKARAELEAPSANALIGDNHTAFGKDQLDVTKTQDKYVVKPDRMADQLGRER